MLRVPTLEAPNRIDGVASAGMPLEIADMDPGSAGNAFGRGEADIERRHVLCPFLERIAWRDQPPYPVQSERADGIQADAPVGAVSRVEGAAEEADARHNVALASPLRRR